MVGMMPARSRSYSPYSRNEATAPMRRAKSLPADFAIRRLVSFTTTISPLPTGSSTLPSVHIELADNEQAARRGVSFIVKRSNRRKSQFITHTMTIDAWLLTLILGFSLLGTASGYVLGNPAHVSQHGRAASASMGFDAVWVPGPVGDLPTMRRTANLAPRGAPPEDGIFQDIIFPPVDEREPEDATQEPAAPRAETVSAPVETSLRETATIEIPARWRNVPESDRPAKWRTTPPIDVAVAAVDPEAVNAGESSGASALAPRQLHTTEELAALLAAPFGTPTVVVFGAKGCRTCHALQPRLQKIAAQAGATFTYLHYGKPTHEAFVEHEVTKTPTVHVYNGGGTLIDSSVYAPKDVAKLASVLKAAEPALV